MATKTVVQPKERETPFGVWSPAIIAEGSKFVFVSGITSRDANGNVVGEGDIRAQTRQVCTNLQATVEAAGGTLEDVVSVTVYVKDIEQFDDIHAVRAEFFPEGPPASTMVQIVRLVDERSLIEMNAVVALD